MILTPEFSRLSDWLGVWAMEEIAFRSMVEILGRIDLFAHTSEKPPEIKSAMEKTQSRGNSQSIAIIKMAGTLMKSQSSMGGTSTVQLRRDIRQAAADPEVGGILLAIDSPGGTVAGTDDLASEVRAARRMKPVYAHIDDLGASAAYWVASQAEAIYANSPTAMVGSIGTYVTVYDSSENALRNGIKAYNFSTGALKGAGAKGVPLTDAQREHYQQLIDESQKTFDEAVRTGRNLTPQQLAEVRHGGIFLANSAMGKKLIDGVRPMGATIDAMMRRIGTGGGRMAADLIDDRRAEAALLADLGLLLAFTHNSRTSPNEPAWGSVDKSALPRLAFAAQGEEGKKATWGYPHHWVQDAAKEDDNGVWTEGTLLLHTGGLNAAWAAAQGAHTGRKAPQAVIDHLQEHRRALGLA